MRKVLALVLAVMMLLTLNVGALAEETTSDIVAYGGGEDFLPDGYVFAVKGTFDPDEVYSSNEVIQLSSAVQNLYVGETLELAVYAYERDVEKDEMRFARQTEEAVWEAQDPEIATISNNGVVTAVSTGGWKDGIALARFVATIPAGSGKWEYDYDYLTDYFYIRVMEENITEDDFIDNRFFVLPIIPGVEPSYPAPNLELYIGETAQYGVFQGTALDLQPYTGEVHWEVDERYSGIISISETGLLTAVGIPDNYRGDSYIVWVEAIIPVAGRKVVKLVNVKRGTNPNPSNPSRPSVVDSGASSSDRTSQPTANAANDDKTASALRSGESAEVKVTNSSSALSVVTADILGGGQGKLTLINDGMTVTIPGGFGKVTEAGRIYFPFEYDTNPKHAADMLAAVKGEGVKSEAVKAGGAMTLPTTATVTLKTKLTGTVNVYLYDEDAGKFTLIASPVVKDGTITFTTRQMGYMLLTTGRI